MRKLFGIALLVLMGASAVAGPDDIGSHRSCAVCGMDRKAYGFSRMLVRFSDGTETGFCSLHCAVRNIDGRQDRSVTAVLTADRNDHQLLDARTAIWVSGGSKRGVMTQVPAWAFAAKAAAEAFIADYGGKIASYDEVVAAAREEIARERR